MKYPIWKPIVILAVLAACVLLLWPPAQKLKPGLDLAGGTTLIYDVRVPENADATQVIDDLINVLRDRVDPTGTRNLVWRQVAGNRIEIQMAVATPEAKQRRETYLAARQALLDGNLTPGALNAALAQEGEARAAALARLADGDEALLSELRELAEVYDAFVAANEPYQAAQDAFNEAQGRLDALPQDAPEDQRTALAQEVQQLQQNLIDRAQAYLTARRALDAAQAEVLARNVEPAELERALDAPVERTRRGRPTRGELVAELQEKYPSRADQIAAVAQTYTAYEAVKGPLDDPNDLIALLQGSGVLEFRIAAPLDLPAVAQYREQLAERGPRAGTDRPWRWFPVDDIDQFVEDRRDEALLVEDAAAFFAARGLIGQAYGDDYYVLLGNTPDRAMTREQNWELRSASRGFDQLGRNAVNFSLDAPGGDLIGAITGAHVGQQMAILLDNQVISAPTLQGELGPANNQITGSFSDAELTYLLRTIKAGSTEAELSEYPISIKTTGPQLGQDNLRRGVQAAVLSLVVVAVFMAVYYFALGLFADFALITNMIIILGVMALFDATFTLPGIAGIVLTIGMSVDANVLIFERIREELERKAELATAVRLGFQKALSSIVDANLTTLITCVVLFYTATADIKGFAITLMIGIIATLFTALFCTRVLIDLYMLAFKPKTLHMLPSAVPAIGRFLTPNVDWLGKRYLFMGISLTLLVVGLTMVAVRGSDMLDIEFRSGTQVSFTLDEGEALPIGEVRERLQAVGQLADRIQEGQPVDASAVPAGLPNDLLPQVRQLVEDTQARFQTLVAEAAERREQGVSGGEAPDAPPDLGLLAEANVVTEGGTENGLATGFSVVTLITDAQAVSDAVKIAMSDVLTTTRPIDFRGIDETIRTTDAVYPITTADIAQVIGRADVTAQVPDYLGGVAILLEDLQPAATLDDLRERIRRIRLQPAYEDLGFRPFEVYGVGAAVGGEGDQRLYEDVVVVARDRTTNYAENPNALRDADGLAATEWNLVRDALQRDTSLASVSNFSSQVSDTMKQEAIAALTLSLLAVLVYIWFRFGSLRYSVAAIVTLIHDVAVALGMVALSGWLYDSGIGHFFLLDPFKINLALIAAMLTIVGYSLNDTIIVFDRIRENRGRLSFATPQIINDAINQTISRTVITSGTTILAILILYIVGGPGVHGFAFTMLIGIGVGTYSSIAVASPIVMLGAKWAAQRAAAQKAESGAAAAQPAA